MRLQALHQIEITSRCNLRCRYCVHPTMPRPKMDMTDEDFSKAIAWVVKFAAAGTQDSVNICGIGESTIHPKFLLMLEVARLNLGQSFDIVFATNGVNMTEELAKAMVPFRPRIHVSAHRPEKAGLAVDILARHGLLAGVSADPTVAGVNWAGQLKWPVRAGRSVCPWLTQGWAMACADGRITTCAFDGQGVGVIGTLDDDLTQLEVQPYSLCENCHQFVPKQ